MTLTRQLTDVAETLPWGSGIAVVLDASGASHGVGFMAATGVVVTCAHVVQKAGSGPGERVWLAFPQAAGVPRAAAWVDPEVWQHQDGLDVAVLRVDDVPAGVAVLPLGAASGCHGHPVTLFGAHTAGLRGRFGYARAGHLLPDLEGKGQLLQLSDANDVTGGFSGSPVLDQLTGLVIGMVTEIDTIDEDLHGLNVAYSTSCETLRQVDPALSVQTLCPYRGLGQFTVDDAAWFHGRAAAVQRVVDALPRRVVLLLGPSGSGKSSLVQAGLLPEIRAGRAAPGSDLWTVVNVRPGRDLLAELEQAGVTGARSGGLTDAVRARLAALPAQSRLLLVIDQFEEILRDVPSSPAGGSATARARKLLSRLDELIRDVPAMTVVLIMRDDYYPQLAATAPALLQTLSPGIVNIPAVLTRSEAEDIITCPATSVGLHFESGLVAQIISELEAMSDDPGARSIPVTALPVLELTLLQLWERRSDGRLTHDGYRRIGGLAGSLTARCDHSIAGLDDDQQRIARRVLTALVRPGDPDRHIPPARRQVPLDELRELASHPGDRRGAVDDVLRALTTTTPLIVTHTPAGRPDGPPVAELIHDSLIRDWVTLRDWITEDSRFHDWLRRAKEQQHRWAATANSADLLRGSDLAEGLGWSRQRPLPGTVAAFLRAGERAGTARVRRTRIAVTVMAALLVITLGAAVTAYFQRGLAVTSEQTALSRQFAAQSQNLAAGNPDLAALLAVRAYRTSPTGEARTSLYAAYSVSHALRRTLSGHTGAVLSVAFSPDGRTIASGGGDQTVRLWDAATGTGGRILTGHTGTVRSVAFSRDGTSLASAGSDATIRLWDVATGHEMHDLSGHTGTVHSVAFSRDGTTLASAGSDDTVRLWDVATGHKKGDLTGHTGDIFSVAFSPDGATIASGSGDSTVRLWDAVSGTSRHTLTGHTAAVASVAFSRDGRSLVSASGDDTVRLWDVATGSGRRVHTGHGGNVSAVAFSKDGRSFASGSGSGDDTVRLWDAATGISERTFAGHTGPVHSVAVSPDGALIASGGGDQTVRLWATSTGTGERILTGHPGPVHAVTFSPDRRVLASGGGSGDDKVRLWDVASGTTRRILSGHTDTVHSVAFSPDGRTLAGGSTDDTVRLWDVATGTTGRILTDHGGTVHSVAFSPDGRTLASGSTDGTVRLWDVATGAGKLTLQGHTGAVFSVAFSPDGSTVASGGGSGDDTVRLWDVATGTNELTLTGHTDTVHSVAFSPDGRTVASGSTDGTVRLWDLATGISTRTLTGHTDWISSVAFSADGRSIASGSYDGTVRLWDVGTGITQRTLADHTGGVSSVAFSPGGVALASGSADGTVRLWDPSVPGPAAAIDHICAAIGHDVSADDHTTYLRDQPADPVC